MNPHLAKNSKYGKWQSLGLTFMAYVMAYMAAMLTFRQFHHLGDIYGILVADIVATLVIFFLGLLVHNASLYDPYWSVVPVGIAGYWWSLSNFTFDDVRNILLMIVLMYWAIRLTLNWIRGWPGFVHEDWRYEMLRESSGSLYPFVNLGGIHLLPTVLVFLGMVPAYFVLSKNGIALNGLDYIAFGFGMVAVTIEFVADEQMRKFVVDPSNKGKIMNKGLWKYSRHPNYLGEVLFWLSLFLFAFAASETHLWTIIGVVSMLVLFIFGSIPMMDKRSLERRPEFSDYMKKTSGFIMLPPKKL